MAILDSKKIVILGSQGQLGQALAKVFPNAVLLNRLKANLEDLDSLKTQLDQLKPEIILNAAAYTQVDKAESEKDLCFQINAKAPEMLANWCATQNAILVHYSTDYVFDGKNPNPYQETDTTGPINVYGKSKLAGENAILNSNCKHFIFRTSWVFAPWGQNFFKTILRLLGEKEELKIVADQFGSPTYAPDLAKATQMALEQALVEPNLFGLYHLSNQNISNWYEFAKEILKQAQLFPHPVKTKNILPIPTKDYPTPAQRPKNSKLDTQKFESTFHFSFPSWQESLNRAFQELT